MHRRHIARGSGDLRQAGGDFTLDLAAYLGRGGHDLRH
jgi:hypothetical protein